MFPFEYSGAISGLLCGILFGFVLENAGFGSPCKLTAQFHFTDWSVLKVMFTAIVVAASGLVLLQHFGLLNMDAVFVPPSLLVASAVGGTLVGIGFAVGGYCPGTSVVGLFSGRLDALTFVVGLLIGTVLFAMSYGATLENLMSAGEIESGDSITDIWGISPWISLAVMSIILYVVFKLGSWFEKKSGGAMTAEQAVAGATKTSSLNKEKS